MLLNDRLKKAIFALFRASAPRLDYFTTYRAKVCAQSSSDQKDPGKGDLLDVIPDDPRVPPMGGVPFRPGVGGMRITFDVSRSPHVLVGWSAGDPSQPFCCMPDVDDGAVQITIVAGSIYLGDKSTSDGGSLDPVRTGVLTGESLDPFTGAQHFALGNASQHVRAKKV